MMQRRSVPTFVIVFAVVSAAVYLAAVWNNWALFTYHPAIKQLGLGVQRPQGAPAMYWYGWIATAALAGLCAGFVAACLPERLTRRLSYDWSWVVPLCVILVFCYLLRNYFLR